MKQEWMKQTYRLDWLIDRARICVALDGALDFLMVNGIVPRGGDALLKPMTPRTEMDPRYIPADYLASVAAEWDSWGPSSPVEFINALACEVRGARRDIIVEALNAIRGVSVEPTPTLAS